MADFKDCRIGLNDSARLLQVRTSELRDAILNERTLRGVVPPQPMYKTGTGGWVFRAGDVMDVAELLKREGSNSACQASPRHSV